MKAAAARLLSGPETATTSAPPLPTLESTPRALITGSVLGVLLAAGNVYTGLKVGFIDGGSLLAALVGFTLFATVKRLGRTPYSALENNITQTTAASAAIAGFFAGVCGPVPALTMLGHTFPGWAVAVWGACIGLIGILAGTLLRRKLVVEAALPFPTGAATAELIDTMYSARQTALRRGRILAITAAIAIAATWFRDGRPAFIPQVTVLGGTVAGIAASSLTLGISWSPLMLSTGIMVGMRASFSMALGGALSWLVLAPWLTASGIVPDATFRGWNGWFIWPALGLLVAGSFVPLLLDSGTLIRALRDLVGSLRSRRATGPGTNPAGEPDRADASRPRALMPLVFVSVTVMVLVGRTVFGIHPLLTVAALVLALVLAIVAGRATGETDIAPVGAIGTLTQVGFAGSGTGVSVAGGWISMGTASQTSQTLWAFKAGRRLGANPRAQVTAQILGALIGAAVVVPVYLVIVSSYGIGTEVIPAAGAMSWRATAEAVRGGLGSMPLYAPQAGAIALGVGTVLTLLGRTKKIGRFVPLPAAMGTAMLIPASMSAAAVLGAGAVLLLRRARPNIDDPTVVVAAAGGIAGESITGVVIAILIATGLL
jgi:putative OPT family oligopeptide transporter